MKRHFSIFLCFGVGLLFAQHCLGAEAQAATNNAALSRLGPPVKTPWATTSRKVNETRWQSVTIRTNTVTGRLMIRTNSYVELGAGINVPAGSNIFVRANPAFQITATGAEATGTIHKVYVPADIGSGEGLTIIKPDGQQLTFQPLGLNYFDPTDGRSVFLDAVTNAVGWLTASNEIVFSNCFTTIKASIRIRNSPSGFEHDVILHERPTDPTNVGLSSAARLEILTEQLAGATPGASETVIRHEIDPVKRATMLQPDFTDSVLQFGGTNGMKMGRGKAFAVGNPTNAWNSPMQHPVGKTYLTIENRRILIEAVEHRRALPALELLPLATNAPSFTNAALGKIPTDRLMAQFTRRLPALAVPSENKTPAASIRNVASSAKTSGNALLAATAPRKTPEFVIDYGLYTFTTYAETDFTFRGDTTYVVTDSIYLDGTITIEGGAVVKLAPYVPVYVDPDATIVCDTTNYLPAVFTSYL